MRNAFITPFNAFSAFSFVLLLVVGLVAHGNSDPALRLGLAAASAVCGFLLIIMFLVWTLFERE